MPAKNRLSTYQEILLLALCGTRGTPISPWVEHAVAGAVLSELIVEGRLTVESKKNLVTVQDGSPTGDPIKDLCLARIAEGKRRADVQTWLSRLTSLPNLRRKVAEELVRKKILKLEKSKVLWLFTREAYPEINPAPEKEIRARMHEAIMGETPPTPETATLIALSQATGILPRLFDRQTLKSRKKRIDAILKADFTGSAAASAISALTAAIMVCCMVPIITAAAT